MCVAGRRLKLVHGGQWTRVAMGAGGRDNVRLSLASDILPNATWCVTQMHASY